MCARIADFSAAKEQAEYLRWLEDARDFSK